MTKYLKSDYVEKGCRFLTNGKFYAVTQEDGEGFTIVDDDGDHIEVFKTKYLIPGHKWEVLEMHDLGEERYVVQDNATGKFRKFDGTYTENIGQAKALHGPMGGFDYGPGKTILRIESIVVSMVDTETEKRKEYEKKLAALKAEYGVE